MKVKGERREVADAVGGFLGLTVVDGGGLGSSLQHWLGMVSFPLLG